jgi:hypothetical protein
MWYLCHPHFVIYNPVAMGFLLVVLQLLLYLLYHGTSLNSGNQGCHVHRRAYHHRNGIVHNPSIPEQEIRNQKIGAAVLLYAYILVMLGSILAQCIGCLG